MLDSDLNLRKKLKSWLEDTNDPLFPKLKRDMSIYGCHNGVVVTTERGRKNSSTRWIPDGQVTRTQVSEMSALETLHCTIQYLGGR